MSNFLADLKEVLGDEIPSAVLILGEIESYYSLGEEKDPRDVAVAPYIGKVISWEVAQPLLNYNYKKGFGSMDCHYIYIWTKESVLYIREYDGATEPRLIPRNPPTKPAGTT